LHVGIDLLPQCEELIFSAGRWIERTLESVRSKLTRKEFDRLVSALSVLMGWEALVVLKDVRGREQKEAEDVLAFAARAIVDAALHTPPLAKR
jgi:hypothetical protein